MSAGGASGSGGWGAPTPPTSGRSSSAVGILVAIVLLITGLAVGIGFLVTGGDDDPSSGDRPAAAQGDDLRLGRSQTGEVGDDPWTAQFAADGGEVVITAEGLNGFDPILTLVDENGRQITENDDARGPRAGRYDLRSLDSMVEADLDAGRYEVRVRGFAGDRGDVRVTIRVLDGEGD